MVPSFYDGDWIRVATMHNYVQPAVTVAASSYTAIPMPTVPASSSAMRVRLLVSGSASTLLRISNASADTGNITTLGTGSSGEQWIDTVAQENLYYKDLVSPDQLIIRCEGFNMNIPRLAR
jgi:hypothetical protein